MLKTVHYKGLTVAADADKQQATISVTGDKFVELKRLLNRALNCDDRAPQWAFELADSMDDVPVPAKVVRAT